MQHYALKVKNRNCVVWLLCKHNNKKKTYYSTSIRFVPKLENSYCSEFFSLGRECREKISLQELVSNQDDFAIVFDKEAIFHFAHIVLEEGRGDRRSVPSGFFFCIAVSITLSCQREKAESESHDKLPLCLMCNTRHDFICSFLMPGRHPGL